MGILFHSFLSKLESETTLHSNRTQGDSIRSRSLLTRGKEARSDRGNCL